jgi:pyruvate kinase
VGPRFDLGLFRVMRWHAHWVKNSCLSPSGLQTVGANLTCSYPELPNELKLGETILFADGTVAMVVTHTEPGRAWLKVTLAGQLRSRQGLNLPGSELAVKSLTDKDLNDLDWTRQHAKDVDFVGLSFVRSADDVARLRRELVARGDLGVEMDVQRVPAMGQAPPRSYLPVRQPGKRKLLNFETEIRNDMEAKAC